MGSVDPDRCQRRAYAPSAPHSHDDSRHGTKSKLRADSDCPTRWVLASIFDVSNRVIEVFNGFREATTASSELGELVSLPQHGYYLLYLFHREFCNSRRCRLDCRRSKKVRPEAEMLSQRHGELREVLISV